MAGTEVWACEIGDLVVLVVSSRQTVDERVVHRAFGLFVNTLGTVPFVLSQHPIEWGAFLDHQAVGRQVLYVKGEGSLDVCLPVCQSLPGEAVHKVDADVLEPRSP